MPLLIVAAKDIDQAFDILSTRPRKAIRDRMVEEPEGIDSFLYNLREAFLDYDAYHRFDPYAETYLERDAVGCNGDSRGEASYSERYGYRGKAWAAGRRQVSDTL